MTLTETIKSSEDINNLSSEKLKEVYEYLMMDEDDNCFAIMFLTDECPHCKGEAHQFEILKNIIYKYGALINHAATMERLLTSFQKEMISIVEQFQFI